MVKYSLECIKGRRKKGEELFTKGERYDMVYIEGVGALVKDNKDEERVLKKKDIEKNFNIKTVEDV